MYRQVKIALERSGDSSGALEKFRAKAMDDEAVKICLEESNWSDHLGELLPILGIRMKFKREFQLQAPNKEETSSKSTSGTRKSRRHGDNPSIISRIASLAGSLRSHVEESGRRQDVNRWVEDTASNYSVKTGMDDMRSQDGRRHDGQIELWSRNGRLGNNGILSRFHERDDETVSCRSNLSELRSCQTVPPFFSVFEAELKQNKMEISRLDGVAKSLEPSMMDALRQLCVPKAGEALGSFYGNYGIYCFNGTPDICLQKVPSLNDMKKSFLPLKIRVSVLKSDAEEAECLLKRYRSNWTTNGYHSGGGLDKEQLLAALIEMGQKFVAKLDGLKAALADSEIKLSTYFLPFKGVTFKRVDPFPTAFVSWH